MHLVCHKWHSWCKYCQYPCRSLTVNIFLWWKHKIIVSYLNVSPLPFLPNILLIIMNSLLPSDGKELMASITKRKDWCRPFNLKLPKRWNRAPLSDISGGSTQTHACFVCRCKRNMKMVEVYIWYEYYGRTNKQQHNINCYLTIILHDLTTTETAVDNNSLAWPSRPGDISNYPRFTWNCKLD